jgi:hypothetical protein
VSTTTTFKKGDRVRDIKFGGTYTVVFQRGSLMVFVEELSNGWIHPGNLRLVSDSTPAERSVTTVGHLKDQLGCPALQPAGAAFS